MLQFHTNWQSYYIGWFELTIWHLCMRLIYSKCCIKIKVNIFDTYIYIHAIFCIKAFLNRSTQLLPIACIWLWNRRCHFYKKEIKVESSFLSFSKDKSVQQYSGIHITTKLYHKYRVTSLLLHLRLWYNCLLVDQ